MGGDDWERREAAVRGFDRVLEQRSVPLGSNPEGAREDEDALKPFEEQMRYRVASDPLKLL